MRNSQKLYKIVFNFFLINKSFHEMKNFFLCLKGDYDEFKSFPDLSLSSEILHLQKILSFLCAVHPHYDYIEVMELAQAKLILYSLKITHTPNLSLSGVMAYFCSL